MCDPRVSVPTLWTEVFFNNVVLHKILEYLGHGNELPLILTCTRILEAATDVKAPMGGISRLNGAYFRTTPGLVTFAVDYLRPMSTKWTLLATQRGDVDMLLRLRDQNPPCRCDVKECLTLARTKNNTILEEIFHSYISNGDRLLTAVRKRDFVCALALISGVTDLNACENASGVTVLTLACSMGSSSSSNNNNNISSNSSFLANEVGNPMLEVNPMFEVIAELVSAVLVFLVATSLAAPRPFLRHVKQAVPE